jgi:hypothetical protein
VVSLTLNDLTRTEVNSIMFVLDALRSGQEVEVRIGGAHQCVDGHCAVPESVEAIETPYRPNDEVVEATYEIEKPKKRRTRKPKQGTHGSAALDADAEKLEALGADPGPTVEQIEDVPAPTPTPPPAVAVPAITKVDVDAAMAQLAKKGMTVAKSVLSEFRAARTRDLLPEQFPAFIARANEIVNR